jgi:SRSO17 transposase
VAAGHTVNPASWRDGLAEVLGRVADRFARVEPRRTAAAFVAGLLSSVERKNCWWLAEHAGHLSPEAMQRLLRTARWDADAVRDDLRSYVIDHLGHPDGVLIADETGFLKKGRHSVGVQRQYTGTAGRIENAQIAVFLAYTSPAGRALIDRRLYLPRGSWCDDRDRCAAAGVPDQVGFATKPALATQMIGAALDAGVPASWVAADEVYGNDPNFRRFLQRRRVGYVVAVARDHRVTAHGQPTRADLLAAGLPTTSWQRLSAGPGAKGPRYYDWAWIGIGAADEHQWLLIRRHRRTGELAFYRCWAPTPVPLAILVRVAGSRWAVEECFQTAKTHTGLDHYQVRRWTPWHRFITLAMLALALLAVTTAGASSRSADPTRQDPIALTIGEVRHLLAAVVLTPAGHLAHILRWSQWRRRVQARARQSHYKRRLPIEGA